MGTHHYVTTDIDVLKGWPKTEKAVSSADVAKSMGLTVFQITARLKGMERRGFVARNEKGLWGVTPSGKAERENPSPSVSGAHKKMRAQDPTGSHSGPPDDTNVPRAKVTRVDWAPSDDALKECQQRLPVVLQQLSQYQADKKRFRREIMALQVEKEHCEGVINAKRRGKWTSRVVFDARSHGTTIYIAPDMREYVMATAWETADLLLESPVKGISDTRLRLYSTSQVAKRAKKDEKVKQIEASRDEAKKQDARNKRVLSGEDGQSDQPLEFVIPRTVHRRGDGERDAAPRRSKENARRPERDGRASRPSGTARSGSSLAKVQPSRHPGSSKGGARRSG